MLIDVDPSPGFSDESVRVYLATGLTDVGRPDLGDDDEEADLELHWVALADAVAMVFDGEIVNATTAAAVLAVHAVRTGAARPEARRRAVAGPPHALRRAESLSVCPADRRRAEQRGDPQVK